MAMDDPRELGGPDEDEIIVLPAPPVDTDDNDLPNADANGDSDDERPDENEAVPENETVPRKVHDELNGDQLE